MRPRIGRDGAVQDAMLKMKLAWQRYSAKRDAVATAKDEKAVAEAAAATLAQEIEPLNARVRHAATHRPSVVPDHVCRPTDHARIRRWVALWHPLDDRSALEAARNQTEAQRAEAMQQIRATQRQIDDVRSKINAEVGAARPVSRTPCGAAAGRCGNHGRCSCGATPEVPQENKIDEARTAFGKVETDAKRRENGIRSKEAEITSLQNELNNTPDVDLKSIDLRVVRGLPARAFGSPSATSPGPVGLQLNGRRTSAHPHFSLAWRGRAQREQKQKVTEVEQAVELIQDRKRAASDDIKNLSKDLMIAEAK